MSKLEDFDAAADEPLPTTTAKEAVPHSSIIDRIRQPDAGIFDRPPPERAWLVWQDIKHQSDDGKERIEKRGVIGRGLVHLLAGEGGAGKGRWLLTMATCMASAPPKKEGSTIWEACGLAVDAIGADEKVLLILGEDDEIEFHRRAYGAGKALNLNKIAEDRFRDRMRWLNAMGTPFTIARADHTKTVAATHDFEKLAAWLKDNGPWAFIGIDPLARFAGVEENANEAQTQVFAFIERLAAVNGEGKEPPAIVLVDHIKKPNKDDGTEPSQHWIRGASAKVNSARIAMIMLPTGAKVTVDKDGRTRTDASFDESEVAEIGEKFASWHVVKNNTDKKADAVALDFTKHGGIISPSPEDVRLRRERQFIAAQQKGSTSKKGTAKKDAANKPARELTKASEVDL